MIPAHQEGIPGLPQPPCAPDWDGVPLAASLTIRFSSEIMQCVAKQRSVAARTYFGLLAFVRPDGTTSPRHYDLADHCGMRECQASEGVWDLRNAGLIHKVGTRKHGIVIWRFCLSMPFEHKYFTSSQTAESN